MIEYHVIRNFGHPWDMQKRPGFDLLEARSDSEIELQEFVAKAEIKFWSPWIVGNVMGEAGFFGAALYKPCGINEQWDDSPQKPHPGIVAAKIECKKCSGCGFMNVYDPGHYHPDAIMLDDEVCDVCQGSGILK